MILTGAEGGTANAELKTGQLGSPAFVRVPRSGSRGPSCRRGIAAIWALIVLVVVSGVSMCLAARVLMSRRELELDQARAQTEWLCRSGYELAIDRLLARKDTYTGETISPVPGSEIKIDVHPHANKQGVYVITCDVRYRVDTAGVKVQQTTRKAVTIDPSGRAETVADEP